MAEFFCSTDVDDVVSSSARAAMLSGEVLNILEGALNDDEEFIVFHSLDELCLRVGWNDRLYTITVVVHEGA